MARSFGMCGLILLAASTGCGDRFIGSPDRDRPDEVREPAPAGSAGLPERSAFYYGFPSLVNGANGDTALATETFQDYDLVVFGSGLDDPTHADHDRTEIIIRELACRGTRVYGYIDLCWSGDFCSSLAPGDIEGSVDRWAAMGVAGIFLDQAGYDFQVSRERLNTTVDYIHGQGLSAFPNVWNPDDAFSPDPHPTLNPGGEPTHLGPDDYCLHESFAVTQSTYQDPGFLIAKAEQALRWKEEFGTKMATVNTVALENPPFDQDQFDYVWWMTLLYGYDAMAWGETAFFSSESSALPFHPRPDPGVVGSEAVVTHHGDIHRRATVTGTVEVDTSLHVGQLVPGPAGIDNTITQRGSEPSHLVGGDARFSPTELVVTISSNGGPIRSYRLLVDVDTDAGTGFLHSGNPSSGNDWMVENGSLYAFSGVTQTEWVWTFLGPVAATGVGTAALEVPLTLSDSSWAGGRVSVLAENVDPDTFGSLDLLPLAPGWWTVRP